MEKYIKKLKHARHHSHGESAIPYSLGGFKKVIIIVAVVAVLAVISFIILLIVAASWLFNRGDEIAQTGKDAVQQVQPALTPLNLESYVTNNQVNTEQLVQTYNALPSQLQDMWLGQLKTQIEELQAQAGVSGETIQTLLTLYNTLQQG